MLHFLKPAVKRYRQTILFFLPLIIGAVAYLVSYKPNFVVWPSKIHKGFYSDSITQDKGNSGIRQLPAGENVLQFEYILGDKYAFPYVGATFELQTDSVQRISNLSGYDYVVIELDAQLSKRIPIVINQDVQGHSKASVGGSYRPLIKELVYEQGKRDYQIALADLQTPSWWFTMNKLTEKEVGKPDFSRSHSVQVHNCQVLPKNVVERFTIYRIAFYKDMHPFWIATVSLTLLYYFVLLAYLRFGRSIKRIFPRKELVVGNLADEEKQKILSYIAEHYSNPELSLEMMQKDLGMAEGKISNAIKEAVDMNFKRYLNTIRLEEAKRLLKTTDRQVMDIAYKVGYGNVTHFNRVFREVEDCSPNEYRKGSSEKP